MNLSEYIIMFALVAIMGAGLPGPGDAALIAAGTLAGEGKLNVWIVLASAMAAWMLGSVVGYVIGVHGGPGIGWIGMYVGLSYFLGAEIAKRIGNIGTKAVLGVVVIVVTGLVIRAGVSKWRAARQARPA